MTHNISPKQGWLISNQTKKYFAGYYYGPMDKEHLSFTEAFYLWKPKPQGAVVFDNFGAAYQCLCRIQDALNEHAKVLRTQDAIDAANTFLREAVVLRIDELK